MFFYTPLMVFYKTCYVEHHEVCSTEHVQKNTLMMVPKPCLSNTLMVFNMACSAIHLSQSSLEHVPLPTHNVDPKQHIWKNTCDFYHGWDIPNLVLHVVLQFFCLWLQS